MSESGRPGARSARANSAEFMHGAGDGSAGTIDAPDADGAVHI